MDLKSEREAGNTRVKLARLAARYEALRGGTEPDARLRDLSMRSLKRLINQLKVEIARCEAHQPARR